MRRLLIVLIAVMLSVPAYAEVPPVPARKTDIKDIQRNLDSEKARQEKLEASLNTSKKELDIARNALINIASEIRKNEANLSTLEKRIEERTKEEQTLTERLESDYGSIADLIIALERMRRTPPESLIIRPGAPLQTAQSAMLLQSTLPAVNNRAQSLSKDLKRLHDIVEGLKQDKSDAAELKGQLAAKKKELEGLTNKREQIYSRTQADYAQNKKTVERLSKEAKTLMDLISKLETERTRSAGNGVTHTAAYAGQIPSLGQVQLPAQGYIMRRYGDIDDIGAVSRGLSIQTQPGGLAVSPMGGVVRFTGSFKNYGNMVIIEHLNGYHSLVAGLARITASLETTVKAGEPIGELPLSSSRGGPPALYYELRHKGQPIDPAKTFF